jgi:hypothetical protein
MYMIADFAYSILFVPLSSARTSAPFSVVTPTFNRLHHTIGPHYFCTAMPPALASTRVIASRYLSQQLTLMLQASLFCSL